MTDDPTPPTDEGTTQRPAFDPYALLDHPELAKAPGVHNGKRTEPCGCTRDDYSSSHDSQHPGEYENDYGDWETCGWCDGQAFRYQGCTRCGVGPEPAVPAPPAASRTPQADAPDPSWPTCTNCECPIQPGETHRAARRWNEELPGSCYIDDLPALASRTPEPGDGLTDIRSMYEWKALLDAQNDATSGDYRVWSRNLALRASTLIRVVAAADADALAARSTPLPTETCDPNVNPWDCTACKHTEDHPPAPLPTEQADGERWIGGGDQCPDGYEVRGINGSWYDAIDWNNDTYNDGEVIDWVRFPLRRTPDLTPADPEIAAEG